MRPKLEIYGKSLASILPPVNGQTIHNLGLLFVPDQLTGVHVLRSDHNGVEINLK